MRKHAGRGGQGTSTITAISIRRKIDVGANTPVIIKYPFWAMTAENPKAVYACINYNEVFCPKQIENQSVCIDGEADAVLDRLQQEY